MYVEKEMRIEELCKYVKFWLGEAYQVDCGQSNKNNRVKEYNILIQELSSGTTIGVGLEEGNLPEEVDDLKRLGQKIAEDLLHKEAQTFAVDEAKLDDLELIKDQIRLKLVNRQANQESLIQTPYISYLDLAITFYVVVREMENGKLTIRINDEILHQWGITKEQLYVIARRNMERFAPISICSMEKIMMDSAVKAITGGNYEEGAVFLNSVLLTHGHTGKMYVLTEEKSGLYGASGILYPGVLRQFAEEHQMDVILLPSSVHEFILFLDKDADYQEIGEMVQSINIRDVDLKDRLSNSVYLYDRVRNEIRIVKQGDALV